MRSGSGFDEHDEGIWKRSNGADLHSEGKEKPFELQRTEEWHALKFPQ